MAEAILQVVVFGLISPVTAVPAFPFGWEVRRWWLVPVGAIARISLMEGYTGYLIVFLFMGPGLVIGAIAGAAAGLGANRRLSSRHLPAA